MNNALGEGRERSREDERRCGGRGGKEREGGREIKRESGRLAECALKKAAQIVGKGCVGGVWVCVCVYEEEGVVGGSGVGKDARKVTRQK